MDGITGTLVLRGGLGHRLDQAKITGRLACGSHRPGRHSDEDLPWPPTALWLTERRGVGLIARGTSGLTGGTGQRSIDRHRAQSTGMQDGTITLSRASIGVAA